jgi:hypothetical protein
MKRKFRMLMSFLSRLNKDKISVSWSAPDGNPEWFYTKVPQNVSIPQNIINILIDITDSEINEIFEMDCYSETDYYSLSAEIDPKEKKIVYSLDAEYYNNQAETYENKLNNPELEDYFKRTGIEIIEARYSGGGDSGDIDSITIDGISSNITWHSNSDDDKLIWNTLYDNLENAYGGWEIDDGSSGTIELNDNLEIVISHEWSMREMETCEGRYVITENDIEEE